jgi:hypothetical protein
MRLDQMGITPASVVPIKLNTAALHCRVMTGGQRIHDAVPYASLPPTNEAIIASGAGAIGLR